MYARRCWLGERGRAFDTLASRLALERLDGQKRNGGFPTLAETMERLWDIRLLDRLSLPGARRAVDFLLERHSPPTRRRGPGGTNYDFLFLRVSLTEKDGLYSLSGVPFCPTTPGLLKTAAALRFAGEAGQADRREVQQAFATLDALLMNSRWGTVVSVTDLLIAYAAHPERMSGAAVKAGLKRLADSQGADGRFGTAAPFLQTLWAVSAFPSREARRVVARGLPALMRAQHKDGSWGRKRPDFNTLLAVEILKRAGALP